MARYRVCGGCGEFHPGTTPRCADCAPSHNRRMDARRRERQRTDGRQTGWWQWFRLEVIDRDGACLHCGAQADLVVDKIEGGPHRPGDLLDEYQTLCRRCSGRKDGGRPRRADLEAVGF